MNFASRPAPTPRLLQAVRCARLLGHFLWGAVIVASVYPRLGHDQRLRLKQRWSHRLLDILGIELDAKLGDIAPGSLIVANHISWLDIHALNAARPMAFVAKDEVGKWPLVGWLAKNSDTVFLRRSQRGHSRIVNAQVDALLSAQMDVALFPEGTTTEGTHLQAFFSALLQPAVASGRPLRPVALAYFDANGQRSLAPAYAGETTLGQCFAAILACRSLTVRLRATPKIEVQNSNRRRLAQAARGAIAFSLGVPLCNDSTGTLRVQTGARRSGGAFLSRPGRAPAGSP